MLSPHARTTLSTSVIVLAAGFGSRLGGNAGLTPKPLSNVGGVPIVHRTVAGWLQAGAREVIVVVGYRGGEIEQSIRAGFGPDERIRFVENSAFDLANGVSVLVGAEARTSEQFVISMSDHLLSRGIFEQALAHTPVEDGATLFIDRDVEGVLDLDDATKVRTDGDRIVAIGKEIPTYDCIDVGVFRCTDALAASLRRFLDANGDVSLSQGVAELSASGRMRVSPIGDGIWQDVDDPAMLAHAEKLVASDPLRFPTPEP